MGWARRPSPLRDRGRSVSGRPCWRSAKPPSEFPECVRPPPMPPAPPELRRKSPPWRPPKDDSAGPFCDSDHRQSSRFSESTSAMLRSQSSDASDDFEFVRRATRNPPPPAPARSPPEPCFPRWRSGPWPPISVIWPLSKDPTEWIDWWDASRFRMPPPPSPGARYLDSDPPLPELSSSPDPARWGGGGMAATSASREPPRGSSKRWLWRCCCTSVSSSWRSASSEITGAGGSWGSTDMAGRGTPLCIGATVLDHAPWCAAPAPRPRPSS
mmetsp:Transcript_13485/g.43523  ORF Transcript_13485/g.43523 Transcript_13485/m.43523 type:complete len:270 (-) Transcript_13485:61-870(-)